MDELKRCPFCGGKAKLSSREMRYLGQNYYGDKKIRFAVYGMCNRCKAKGPVITGTIVIFAYTKIKDGTWTWMEQRAIDEWNRRAE